MTLYPSQPVLMADDEMSWLMSFETALNTAGIDNIIACSDSREIMNILAVQDIGILLLDLTMPHISGDRILSDVAAEYPNIPVIIITGKNQLDTAVRCIKAGAYDYFVKTAGHDNLVTAVKRAIELQEARNDYALLKSRFLQDRLENPWAFEKIITKNRQMHSIFQYAEAVAPTKSPVMITGETGSGKELIAMSVHKLSKCKGPFTAVNIAGLDDNIFTDTMFGHLKGAFTDAGRRRDGLVAKASGGTLFLDEIGDMSAASQVRLLRLLQEHEYFPLGSDVPLKADVRVIVATQAQIEERIDSGRFRKDLFFRLYTHHIHIPPLRDRMDDLPFLIDYFLEEASAKLGKTKPPVPEGLFNLLNNYNFPGNVRELKSMIFDAVANYKSGWLSMKAFKVKAKKNNRAMNSSGVENMGQNAGKNIFSGLKNLPTIKEASKELVKEALARSGGKRTHAAEMLGITRQALSWRLKKEMYCTNSDE